MTFDHTNIVDGHKLTISVEFDGNVYPNSYRWPTPRRELRGRVRYGRKVISKQTITISCPKRPHGLGDISETLLGNLWGVAGANLARAIRVDSKRLIPQRELEFVSALT